MKLPRRDDIARGDDEPAAGSLRYAGAAPIYWRAGWRGVLPLPYRRKRYPPEGWTGRDAPYPDLATVQGWCRTRGRGNLALRLPPGVLAIDVDAYNGGGSSFARLIAEYGPLPATWTSTSREDGSRQLFYRMPAGLRWAEERAGKGIELVHAGHRYAVVWPSLHNEEPWRPYRWHTPDSRVADRVPRVDELPALPPLWVQRLTEPTAGRTQARTHPGGGGGGAVQSGSAYADRALAGALAELRAMRDGQGRNNALNRKAYHLGGLVAARLLDEHTVRAELLAVAQANGYVAKRGERKARATIESGLRAGMARPARVGASWAEADRAVGRSGRETGASIAGGFGDEGVTS